MAEKHPALSDAPLQVQLAVELILLLEQQQLSPEVVLQALDIVKADFVKKQDLGGNPTSHIPAHTS